MIDKITIRAYNNNQKGGSKMPMTPEEMIKKLKQNGFIKASSKPGSHQKMKNPVTGATTTVPMHKGTLGKGLEHKILKQAGLI